MVTRRLAFWTSHKGTNFFFRLKCAAGLNNESLWLVSRDYQGIGSGRIPGANP